MGTHQPNVGEPPRRDLDDLPRSSVLAEEIDPCARLGHHGPEIQSAQLDGPGDGKVFLRNTRPWRWVPTFLRRRTLLVNRHHVLFRTLLLAAVEDLELAALGLAQAALDDEGLEPERTFRKLLEGTLDEWAGDR